MLGIKEGVKLNGIRAELALAAAIVHSVFQEVGAKTCVITSATDGVHSVGSLHYTGGALDFRTRDLDAVLTEKVRRKVADLLGPEFDVVVEKNHLHVEFQPKHPG